MATPPPPAQPPAPAQRVYEAPCPSCGAPVRFVSAQSASAVCGYCHSTVARSADQLRLIGRQADVFEDHSPLQLHASGQWLRQPHARPQPFTLVGRLQYQGQSGAWNEWRALLDDGSTAWLSEDNGRYVMSVPQGDARLVQPLLTLKDLTLGHTVTLRAGAFTVSAVQPTRLIAAEGEFEHSPPEPGQALTVVELRSPDGQVYSVEFDARHKAQGVSLGQPVQLADLQLRGLREGPAQRQDSGARSFACPQCGSPLKPVLADTKSMSCPQCLSLVDLSQGLGKELVAAKQKRLFMQRRLPLGATGQLFGVDWQIVGFQRRQGYDPSEDEREVFTWDEYLLYNRHKGFSFLVDSEDGWSHVSALSSAPIIKSRTIQLGRRLYSESWRYRATTLYAIGEFYWPVRVGQVTWNVDYTAPGGYQLSSERDRNEIVWSAGSSVSTPVLEKAFGIKLPESADAGKSMGAMGVFIILFLFVLVAMMESCTEDCDPRTQNCSRSSSYGGFSSSGSHK